MLVSISISNHEEIENQELKDKDKKSRTILNIIASSEKFSGFQMVSFIDMENIKT